MADAAPVERLGEGLLSAGAGLKATGPGLCSGSSETEGLLPWAGLADDLDGGVDFCLRAAEEGEQAAALGEGVWLGVKVGRAGLDGEEGLLGWASAEVFFQPLAGPSCKTACFVPCKVAAQSVTDVLKLLSPV